jgi:hypothetical protein
MPVIPVGAWVNHRFSHAEFDTNISSDTPDKWPIVEIELITDQGPITTINATQFGVVPLL